MAALPEEKKIREATVVSMSQRPEDVVVQLRCSDGKEIHLDEATALMSVYLEKLLTQAKRLYNLERIRLKLSLSADKHLSHMPSDLVEKVFHYCSRHAHAHAHAQPGEDLEAFDAQFLNVDYPELCKLIKAAIRFDIDCLWKRGTRALDAMPGDEGLSYYQDLLTLPF